MRRRRQQITIRINPGSLLLHAVGSCGVQPVCPQGFELAGMTARGDRATFFYEEILPGDE